MQGFASGLLAVLGVAGATTTNPFAGHKFYLNPVNQREYDTSIGTASNSRVRENLETMRATASAYWIDRKNKIKGSSTRTVEGILADAAARPEPELVVLIWYDFPNRDCAAAASTGEICCAYNADRTCDWGNGGDCAAGIHEYKTEYTDPFVTVLAEYRGKVPVVIVFEPDSLPNFATNMGKPHCGSLETQNAYHQGAEYALAELTTKTDATVYIDAAHGGWIGWADNMMKFMATLKKLKLPFSKIRGFTTNVAGYQSPGVMCPWEPDGESYRNGYCLNGQHAEDPCCADPCGLLSQYNPAHNELNFAQQLRHAAAGELDMDAHIVIDTGRSGVPHARTDCANWCNVRGAGAGPPSGSMNAGAGSEIVDAFFYLKTPGESDGCTKALPSGSKCPRFDLKCGSLDSIGSRRGEPRAPEAGGWFDYQVKELAEFAHFSLAVSEKHAVQPSKLTAARTPRSPLFAKRSVVEQTTTSPSQRPPAPSPIMFTRPEAVTQPVQTLHAAAVDGKCCWGSSCGNPDTCDVVPGWCSRSRSHCAGKCRGIWCQGETEGDTIMMIQEPSEL